MEFGILNFGMAINLPTVKYRTWGTILFPKHALRLHCHITAIMLKVEMLDLEFY